MKLAKYFTRVAASMEAEAREEILHDIQHGNLSDQAMAIESQRDGAAELAVATAESFHAARRMDNDASELCELENHTRVVRDTIETVNAAGGFSAESMGWANLALRSVLGQAVPQPPQLSASTEAFAEGRQILSLEDVDSVLQTIGEVRADVENKSVDAILRVFDVLKDAMPEVKDRLIALQQALPTTAYDESKQIRLDDLVFKSLAVNGTLPSSIGGYLGSYSEFANCILSSYSENALESASKTKLAADAMASLGDNCPIKALAKVYGEIGDPRNGIPMDQLCFALPGSGALFGNKIDPAAVDETAEDTSGEEVAATEDANITDVGAEDLIQRLQLFCTSRAPLDPLSYDDRSSPEGDNPTISVLSKDSIGKGLCELIKAFEVVDIKSFAESRRQTWVQSRSAFGAFQQQLVNIQPSQVAALRPVLPALGDYLDTVFALSAWPALHLLTNLVFTANGFLLLAERSIAGQTEEAPAEDAPTDEVDAEADAAELPADTVETPVEGAPAATDADVVAETTETTTEVPAATEAPVETPVETETPTETETPAPAEGEGAEGEPAVTAPEGVDVTVKDSEATPGEKAPEAAAPEVPPAEETAGDELDEVPVVEEEEEDKEDDLL